MRKSMLPLVSRVVRRPSVGARSRWLSTTYSRANFTPNPITSLNRRGIISIVSPEFKRKGSSHNATNSDGDSIEHEEDWQLLVYSALTFWMLRLVMDEFYTSTTCVGPSMLPTFKEDGDVVIVERLDHTKSILGRLLFNQVDENGKPRRIFYKKGDAVISYCKDDLDKTVCKRIAAVEGERVSYRGNGILPSMVRVPKGHVWLLGDNPANSRDSRHYGAVPVGLIQGRIICKVNIPYGFFLPDLRVLEWVEHEYPPVEAKRKKLEIKNKVEVKNVDKVDVPMAASAPGSLPCEGKDHPQRLQRERQQQQPHQDEEIKRREQNRQQLSLLHQQLYQLKQIEHSQLSCPQDQQRGQDVQRVDMGNVVVGTAAMKGRDDCTGNCVDTLTAECGADGVIVGNGAETSNISERIDGNESSHRTEISDDRNDRKTSNR